MTLTLSIPVDQGNGFGLYSLSFLSYSMNAYIPIVMGIVLLYFFGKSFVQGMFSVSVAKVAHVFRSFQIFVIYFNASISLATW